MALPKFQEGARVRVVLDGRPRNGRIKSVVSGYKRGSRREYVVTADSNGNTLGRFISKQLQAR